MIKREKMSKMMNWVLFGTAGFLTAIFLVAGYVAESVYEWTRGPIEAKVAVGQVKDDPEAYTATRIAASNFPVKVIWGAMSGAIICTWLVTFFIYRFKLRITDL